MLGHSLDTIPQDFLRFCFFRVLGGYSQYILLRQTPQTLEAHYTDLLKTFYRFYKNPVLLIDNKKELTFCKFYQSPLFNSFLPIHRRPTSSILLSSDPQTDFWLPPVLRRLSYHSTYLNAYREARVSFPYFLT